MLLGRSRLAAPQKNEVGTPERDGAPFLASLRACRREDHSGRQSLDFLPNDEMV